MNMKEYINEAEAALLHTYNRYPIVWDRGDGMYLYDMKGKNTLILYLELVFLRWDTIIRHIMMR